MGIIIGLVCIVLICVMFVQFKTVEETDITAIENMKEDELRTTLSEWKTKYEETYEKYEETIATIDEYNKKIESSEEASELLDKELENSNLIVGNTDIYGEGIIVTLTDNNNQVIVAEDLLELINELRYAGAEAISINDVRIINTTDIVEVGNTLIMVGGQRLSSPYVVKAIGNQAYLSSILSLKNSGFIDKYNNSGKTVTLVASKKVEILKRGKSGVAVMAQITGSKNTLRIYTEYNLRNLFGGEKLIYLRKDKKEVSGLSCLPSGYFTIEKKGDSYIFTGGGYGHGVGMSQNGANQMAAQGKKCEEILKFYFLGSILQYQKSV